MVLGAVAGSNFYGPSGASGPEKEERTAVTNFYSGELRIDATRTSNREAGSLNQCLNRNRTQRHGEILFICCA